MYAGEGAGKAKDVAFMESLSVDVPLDGMGLIGFPAADAISPVFTLWITLVLMYLGTAPLQTKASPTPLNPIGRQIGMDLNSCSGNRAALRGV